jgi:hypothetical protein
VYCDDLADDHDHDGGDDHDHPCHDDDSSVDQHSVDNHSVDNYSVHNHDDRGWLGRGPLQAALGRLDHAAGVAGSGLDHATFAAADPHHGGLRR